MEKIKKLKKDGKKIKVLVSINTFGSRDDMFSHLNENLSESNYNKLDEETRLKVLELFEMYRESDDDCLDDDQLQNENENFLFPDDLKEEDLVNLEKKYHEWKFGRGEIDE